MTNKAIVVLGHQNDASGVLSNIAKQRCDRALDLASLEQPYICTGGIDKHFNTTSQPHSHYLRTYLQKNCAQALSFLPLVHSRNTYEDGKLTAEIVNKHQITKLTLVTSDFHLERAFLWTKYFMPAVGITCFPSKTQTQQAHYEQLLAHEEQAVKRFYLDFPDFPKASFFTDWPLD